MGNQVIGRTDTGEKQRTRPTPGAAAHRLVAWFSRVQPLEWAAVCGTLMVASMLMALSVMRYTGYNASMLDIGNMSQAIWSGVQGTPLEYTPPQFTWEQGNVSRLALHVELIYLALVPLYALWPDPRTLLAVQALWFGLGAWPVYRLGVRHLQSRGWALGLTGMYLLYPAAQTAVLFDVHGDTLAMPLSLLALEALDRRAWRSYAMWLVLALGCKFYVAAAVAVLGAVLWWKGERRAGAWTLIGSAAWLALVLGVIRPLFAPPLAAQSHATFASYLRFYFTSVGGVLLGTALPRVLTAVVVFTPGMWLGRHAWQWCLPACAVAVPALLSGGEHASYDFRFHHYALTVPFFIMATTHGAGALRRRQEGIEAGGTKPRRPWQGELFLAVGITVIFNMGLVDTPLNPQFWMDKPNWGRSQWRYGQTERDRFKDRWLAQHVPARVPLAANEFLAPHLANRETLGIVRYPDEQKLPSILAGMHYVIADALHDYAFSVGPDLFIGGALHDVPGIRAVMAQPEFKLLVAQDGLLLFGRATTPGEGLAQQFRVRQQEETDVPQVDFGGRIGMLSAKIEPLVGQRFRLHYEWVALQPLERQTPLFAVSRLEGVAHSRIVHLPTEVLHPTTAWQMGQVVEETLEVALPDGLPAGTYHLWTGWYDGRNIFAAATDARGRVGSEAYVGAISVP